MTSTIVVCGAGTMGSGIAQAAASGGFRTILYDLSARALEQGEKKISGSLDALATRQKLSRQDQRSILSRLVYTTAITDCIGDLVIEAVAEREDIKISLFRELETLNDEACIFATNTSSLSVTRLADALQDPGSLCGMHFFNPAPVMKLVEVVRTDRVRPEVIRIACDVVQAMGKTPVICTDAPGFIVNRVARHYYLEALRLVESGYTSPEQADRLLESCGFRMGPFRLMDLIGNDINYAVTESLYQAFGKAERFKPSRLQREKIEKGELGRKSGRGYYPYPQETNPEP